MYLVYLNSDTYSFTRTYSECSYLRETGFYIKFVTFTDHVFQHIILRKTTEHNYLFVCGNDTIYFIKIISEVFLQYKRFIET